jgi:hypothetical protein
MKAYFTFAISFLLMVSMIPQKKKELYVIDFHNDKEYNSILGKHIANEFSHSLQQCNSKYQIVPRIKYQEQLEGKTFEETKIFLEQEGIDFFIYGDVFHDDDSKHFMIEYILEEVNTGSITLIKTVVFDHISKLVNASLRKEMIKDGLKKDKEFCKQKNKRSRRN